MQNYIIPPEYTNTLSNFFKALTKKVLKFFLSLKSGSDQPLLRLFFIKFTLQKLKNNVLYYIVLFYHFSRGIATSRGNIMKKFLMLIFILFLIFCGFAALRAFCARNIVAILSEQTRNVRFFMYVCTQHFTILIYAYIQYYISLRAGLL